MRNNFLYFYSIITVLTFCSHLLLNTRRSSRWRVHAVRLITGEKKNVKNRTGLKTLETRQSLRSVAGWKSNLTSLNHSVYANGVSQWAHKIIQHLGNQGYNHVACSALSITLLLPLTPKPSFYLGYQGRQLELDSVTWFFFFFPPSLHLRAVPPLLHILPLQNTQTPRVLPLVHHRSVCVSLSRSVSLSDLQSPGGAIKCPIKPTRKSRCQNKTQKGMWSASGNGRGTCVHQTHDL